MKFMVKIMKFYNEIYGKKGKKHSSKHETITQTG